MSVCGSIRDRRLSEGCGRAVDKFDYSHQPVVDTGVHSDRPVSVPEPAHESESGQMRKRKRCPMIASRECIDETGGYGKVDVGELLNHYLEGMVWYRLRHGYGPGQNIL